MSTGFLPGFADEDTSDWPVPVFFPQTPASSATTTPPQTAKPRKKGHHLPKLHFRKKKATDKPALTDEQITKVGPKDPPPSPYPLLRLPMPIVAGNGTISSGIYLVKPSATPNSGASGGTQQELSLVLTRQDRVLLSFKAYLATQPDANQALTGTASPITRIEPPATPMTHVEAQPSEDGKTMTIIITENEQRFESDPFPIIRDARHILTF